MYAGFASLLIAYNGVAELLLVVADKTIGTLLATSAMGRPRPAVYITVFALRFLLALTIQAVVELFAYPRWGHVTNILGRVFSDRQIMLGLGVCLFIALVGLLPWTRRLARAVAVGGSSEQPVVGGSYLAAGDTTPLLLQVAT